MSKQFLFIPFLALLATSCGGGHITTTPVLNAPRAQAFTPTQTNLANETALPEDVAYLDMGTLNWTKVNGQGTSKTRFIAQHSSFDFPSSETTTSKIFCKDYNLVSWSRIFTNDNVIAGTYTGGGNYIGIVDPNYTEASVSDFKTAMSGKILYYYPKAGSNYQGVYTNGYTQGYTNGYNNGMEDGYYSESNKIIPNGMYTGLTIFPRRHYLEEYAQKVLGGQVTPENGVFYLDDTNANYTIEMKWTYNANEMKTTFDSYGGLIVGELDWHDVADGYWNTSWFGKYDAELHHFLDTKNYATNAPIETSFYPEVYVCSSTTGGDPNLYFAGGGNGYQMGFADGQTQTIHASETYNNVFTIFTPAFRAVADFFNLNIGPFKVWYFFAIPLIVTLLILVLRLVKH